MGENFPSSPRKISPKKRELSKSNSDDTRTSSVENWGIISKVRNQAERGLRIGKYMVNIFASFALKLPVS